MISVLLCTLNRPVLIKNCIRSFLSQTYKDLEIIVVDQSPDDETEKSCKEFDDDRIKYHHVDFTGLSKARNYGLKHAKGEWICLGDDDAVYDKQFFYKAMEFTEKHGPECILCGKLFFLDDREKAVLDYKAYYQYQELDTDGMMQIGASATLLLPARILKEIKGFDTRFGVGARYGSGEETDVVLRMFKKGIKAYHIEDMQVFHGDSKKEEIPDLKKILYYYIGLGALLKKHLWYDRNTALLPKAVRATLGAFIKWMTGDKKQKDVYRMRIAGFYRGFFVYKQKG